jgi:tetratricopeptide (TPR) repeat protein
MIYLSRSHRTQLVFGLFLLSTIFIFSQNTFGQSTISGIVFDKQRNPLIDVDIELLNDLYQTKDRTKTDGSGRYTFAGLRNGRYFIKVLPFRYDLEDQTQEQEINTQNVRGGEGSGFFNLDFYLLPRKGGLADSELSIVFSQDIPPNAKKLYEKGVELLANKKTTEGVMQLNEALKIFPDYFLVLMRIGKELMIIKNYKDAVPFFFKAANVNPKSATAFYYLGDCLHYLGKEYNKSALAALNQAVIMAPASTRVLYVLGKVEREEGKYAEAEKHLLQAKKLSKNPIPEIHKELAQLYGNDLKKYKEAADELELYLKASKVEDKEEKNVKKIISDLRGKANSQSNNN